MSSRIVIVETVKGKVWRIYSTPEDCHSAFTYSFTREDLQKTLDAHPQDNYFWPEPSVKEWMMEPV
jgi:hypothetical protein